MYLVRSSFKGKFFHIDYSENINITEKHHVQEAHFSRKQYMLHCTLIEPANPHKLIYHLSDDTIHDPAMVILCDIFDCEGIHNEVLMLHGNRRINIALD